MIKTAREALELFEQYVALGDSKAVKEMGFDTVARIRRDLLAYDVEGTMDRETQEAEYRRDLQEAIRRS